MAGDEHRDARGRRRSPVTQPGRKRTTPPANKGMRLPAEVLSPREIDRLFAAKTPRGPALEARDLAMISMLYRDGVKAHQLIALGTGHARIDEGILEVPGSSGKSTQQPLHPTTGDLLTAWIAERERLEISPARRLFCTVLRPYTGGPLRTAGVRQVLRERADRAGLHRRVTSEGLRKSGREHAEARAKTIELRRPEGTEWEDALARITDDSVRGYVEEAMNCLAVEAYRAAVVFLWAGAVRSLQERALAVRSATLTRAISKHTNRNLRVTKLDDFAVLRERDLLMVFRELDLLTRAEAKRMQAALDVRNDCAHPTAYSPGEKQVAGLIDEMVRIVWP